MRFMFNNELFKLKSENVTLLQAMQIFLNVGEIEELNLLLYEYIEAYLANHVNHELTNIIYEVKIQFNRLK